MKISYNWLKRYMNVDIPAEAAEKLLTDSGLEVEGLEKIQSVKGGLEGIVIGEVLTCEKHPNADKLSVTTVNVGGETPLQIVCGAPNVAAGQKVPVAVIGAVIYSDDDSFAIKKSKLRGVPSEGMICAEDELGLGKGHDGIMVLDEAAEVGTPAKEFFHIEEDWLIEIGLTPNRTDAISHIGVARDLVAVLNNLSTPSEYLTNGPAKLIYPQVGDLIVDNHDLDIDVRVEDQEACPRYTGISMTGLKVQESPDWLKNALNAIGVRPINNLVDISNYVLFETGQPLHFFDADAIAGQQIVVKKLPAGSQFTTLDGVKRELTGRDLMICDAKQGMCIAGVFGGEQSGVTETTTRIFIESAHFHPATIRKTARHFGLQTDASFRFERGTDANNTVYALKRAVQLIREIVGGQVASDLKDHYPVPVQKNELRLSFAHTDRLIGKVLDCDQIKNILHSLEIEVLEATETDLLLAIPTYRVDVTREPDVIEEILRIYGYNNVEFPSSVRSSLSFRQQPDPEKIRNQISDHLSAGGFNEIMNNSLTKGAYYENLKTYLPENCVKTLNPLSQDLNVMRQTLLFGGLESVAYNRNRQHADMRFYEFGKVYRFDETLYSADDQLACFGEENHLALFMTGKRSNQTWDSQEQELSFFDLKASVHQILKRLNIGNKLKVEHLENEIFAEGLRYSFKKKKLVEFGRVSKAMLKLVDIKQPVFFAEFNWELVLELTARQRVSFTDVPRFPEVRRDLALVIDKSVEYQEIEKLAFETERKLLKRVNLFDIYEGDKIEAGKKSYAVSFFLQDVEKTLNDKQIEKIMQKLVNTFAKKLNASIRG